MGCNGWFNGCADGSDLSSAAFVVPLVAAPDEEGVTLVYLGRSVDDQNVVDSSIERVPNEELAVYRGDNQFQTYMLSAEGIVDYMNHSVAEALATIEVGDTHGQIDDFEILRDTFANPDDAMPAATMIAMNQDFESAQQIMAALNAANEIAQANAQSANEGIIPEGTDIAGYSDAELGQILINWAEAANDTVDRIHLAQDLPYLKADLIQSIHDYPDLKAEVVNALQDEIENGPIEGGPQHYDHSQGFDQTMTMVPG